jgi:CII-binding regulator of phage lambda lysogenization HflD
MANMTLRLPDDLDSQLKAQSQEKGISKHHLILDVLTIETGLSLEHPYSSQDTLGDLQSQIDQLKKQVKVLASHAGYPYGSF